MAQRHLTKKEAINLGSFYTPKRLVDIAYSLLDKANAITKYSIFLDTSCGYGDFFLRRYARNAEARSIASFPS